MWNSQTLQKRIRGVVLRNPGAGVRNWIAFAAFLALSATLAHAQAAQQLARVKDVATIEGIRDNQLVGYGLVVGLRGTGDSSQTVFPAQTLISALERMGITVPQTGSNSASNMQVKNMAAVFVVATLPPFSRPGYKVDVTASSAGDARSLEGGILLMTPLYGPDGQIYAQAQGAIVLGGYMAASGGNTRAAQPSHHGAHSGRGAGGTAHALRPAANAHGQRGAERCRLSHRRADGRGHRPEARVRRGRTPSTAGGWRSPSIRARISPRLLDRGRGG